MKILNRIKILWLIPLFITLALFRPFTSVAQDDTNDFLWLDLLPPGCCIGSWSFDETNLDSDFGFAPLSYANVEQVPDWDGNALQVDSTNAAWLTYGVTEDAPGYGEYTNLTLDTGSIEFWFVANWESADTNFYGSGPGDWGRFIDVGTWTTNADCDWWSLYLNPEGTGIYFSSGTNGVRTNYLSTPISWDWNTWHMIVLTYSQTNTFLYLDGQLVASGTGVCYMPSGDILTNGFAIGSDFATGMQQAHGQFDDLETYNYQLNADDVTDDYAETYPELPETFRPGGGFGADDDPLPPGGTNGGDGSYGDDYGPIEPDYGSNLWVAVLGVTNNALSLLETNTENDVLYELQGCTNLASPNWMSFGFVNGSELTNCTPATAPIENNGTMFYRVRSWQSIGGVPVWWWLTYFGQATNVDANSFSPSGDGWTLLQCFLGGLNPTNFVTPPAPQGLTINSYNNTNHTAALTWLLSIGATGYIVQTPSGTNIVGSSADSYIDSSSSSSASYSIQAIYGGGLSAWSPSVSVAEFESETASPVSANNILSASIIGGPQGSAYLAVSAIPADTTEIEITRTDFVATTYFDDDSYNTSFYITVTNAANGFYSLTNLVVPPDLYVQEQPLAEYDIYLQTTENWYAWAIETNGISTQPIFIGSSYTSSQDGYETSWTVPPYFDGREQLKQNLIFLLRQAGQEQFGYVTYSNYDGGLEPYGGIADYSSQPANYVYAGFYDTESVWTGYNMTAGANGLDACRPFYENYIYANFIFSPNDFDEYGNYSRVVQYPVYPYDCDALTNVPPLLFQQPTANGASITAQINSDQFLYSYPLQPIFYQYFETNGVWYDMMGIGITYTVSGSGDPETFTMENTPVNYFGLPIVSAYAAYYDEDFNFYTEVLSLGDSFTGYEDGIFTQVAQPQFQTVEYDLWNASSDVLPGESSFSPTNASRQPFIVGVGNPANIACYEKLAVTNGNPGLYGYLDQYFTNAYQIDDSGNVTTNLAGMLSPYGQFFATEPGQAALVTMPDPDTGQKGTGVVDVISLNVDANRDGTMDFSFTGPDSVSADNPYRFWVNDDQDAGDDGGNGGISIPGNSQADGINPSTVDDDGNPLYKIHGSRDLVDFFPVYVNIGSLFQSNALSAGISFTDTNWQYVLSQGDGALRFQYSDLTPSNYTNYLRDLTTISNLLDNPYTYPFLTTVSNTGVALSSSFIANIATNNGGIILVEAWEPTAQPLLLTIYHGTNQVVQTSLSLSISEVEQMFRHKNIMLQTEAGMVPDRTNDESVPNEPPTNDKNFIFAHGYNVNPTQARGWDSDIFKRLYWSGSHAKFYGVTWEAADSQIADAVTVNLQTNVVNAFNTAPLLNSLLNSLSGTNIVAAHSLGNMLVLSTLNDYTNQNINTYFMIDAAVAIEAIDSAAESNPDMYPSAWTGYNANLLASGWHTLWPASDARSTLAWSSRLTNFQSTAVYNFYSSGEEVLRDYSGDPPSSLPDIAADEATYAAEGETGEYTWVWQEKNKGLMGGNWVLSSDHGGWQLNEAYETNFDSDGVTYWEPMSPAAAAELTTTQLQTNAFFNFASGGLFSFNNDLALETSSGSGYAQTNRNRIISDAIPALTLPVGANAVSRLAPQNGNDQNFDEQADFENGWPADRGPALYPSGTTAAGEWHHSDVRAVAYPFTYLLFNQIATVGNLK
jgi:hypothetical protein